MYFLVLFILKGDKRHNVVVFTVFDTGMKKNRFLGFTEFSKKNFFFFLQKLCKNITKIFLDQKVIKKNIKNIFQSKPVEKNEKNMFASKSR